MSEDISGTVARLRLTGGEPAIFVMRCPAPVKPSHVEHIQATWAAAWAQAGSYIPMLLVIDDTMSIEALSGAQLEELGLQRIPGKTSS